jgi:hypothetical protein
MAVIAEGDDAGTADTTDDVFTMTGLGLTTNLKLRPWASSSVTVDLLDSNLTASATIVQHGPSSDIFQEVVGVPGVTLDHQVLLYPPLGGMSSTFLVPTSSGPFADPKLWAVATAGTGNDWSRSYERGVAAPRDPNDSVTLVTSGFLDLPSVREPTPARYEVDSNAELNRLELSMSDGQQLNVLLLPSTNAFDLPAGAFSGRPTGISVEAFDWPLAPQSFDFKDLIGSAQRIAYAQIQPN